MVHENGALDATLAAAAGDDPALLAELRAAMAGHVLAEAELAEWEKKDL